MIFKNLIFRKYFNNTLWLFSERFFRMGGGLLIGIFTARYLGPEKYGILSYVTAFCALLSPLGKVGLDGIVSRDVAKDQSDISVLISTSFFIKLVGGALIIIISTGYCYFYNNSMIYIYLSLILSSVYLVKALEVIEFYFRARVKGKLIALCNYFGFSISLLLKIFFIINKNDVLYFALAQLFDVMVVYLMLVYFYISDSFRLKISDISISKAKYLIKESYLLTFSGVFALIYLNIDQIMIGNILGVRNVAIYSVATKISSAFYIIPMVIRWSIQTAMVKLREDNQESYHRGLQKLFDIMVIFAYIIIIVMIFISHPLILFLYGPEYKLAGSILSIHIISLLFVFIGIPLGLWVINESFFKLSLFSNIIASIINIVINLFWIPKFGIMGAAYATLISYSFTYFWAPLFFMNSRPIFLMQFKSLFLINVFYQISHKKNN